MKKPIKIAIVGFAILVSVVGLGVVLISLLLLYVFGRSTPRPFIFLLIGVTMIITGLTLVINLFKEKGFSQDDIVMSVIVEISIASVLLLAWFCDKGG
jgi:uncharacterized membrane protein HdeD (DUF308 family)